MVMRLIGSGELRAHRLSEKGHWRVERKTLDELMQRIRRKYLDAKEAEGTGEKHEQKTNR